MSKKPTIPDIAPALVHAAGELDGEVRYFAFEKGCGTHYIVVRIGQGEQASITLIDDKITGREWIVTWPFGSIDRQRFICPTLAHVRKVLADLSVTPLPKKENPNDRR